MKNKRINILIIILTLLIFFPAFLQSNSLTDLKKISKMSLEELMNVKVKIASKSEETLSQTPSTVTVYSKKEIDNMGIHSLEALLNFVPGAQSARTVEDGLSYTPSFRGRREHSSAKGILVLIDGMRLNDAVNTGTFSQEIEISLDNVKQVEIIRGPGSAMYGANAFAGVINLIMDRKKNRITAKAGTFGAANISGQVSHHGKWKGSFSFKYYNDTGQGYEPFFNFMGLYEKTYDPKRLIDVYGTFNYSGFELKTRYSKRIYKDFILSGAFSNGNQKLETDNFLLSLNYRFELNNNLKFKLFSEYSQGEFDILICVAPAEIASETFWTNGDHLDFIGGNIRTIKQYRIGFDSHLSVNKKLNVFFGGVFRNESTSLNPFQGNWDFEILKNEGYLVPASQGEINAGYFVNGQPYDLFTPYDRNIYGLYSEGKWNISRKMTATAGIRYDHYEDSGSTLNSRLGLVYHIHPKTTFKVLYGEAFRAPSFTETRAISASLGDSNPDLKPENIKTYELSWSQKILSINLTATFFYSRISDMIELLPVEGSVEGFFALKPQNSGNLDLSGFELEFNSQISSDLLLRSGITIFTAYKKDNPVAPETAFFILNYNRNRFNINLNGYYHSSILSRERDGIIYFSDIKLDSFFKLNLALRYKLTKSLTLLIDIHNLNYSKYKTYSNSFGLENGLPSRGRSVMAGIIFDFSK